MTGASDAVPIALKQRISRNRKIGVVQDIKNFCPELHAHGLAWFESLLQRNVDVGKSRSRDCISSEVAIGPWRRQRKSARIIEQLRRAQRLSCGYTCAPCRNSVCGIAAESRIQVRTIGRPPVTVSGTIESHGRRERRSRSQRGDSVGGPAAQNQAERFLLKAEWKRIRRGSDKTLSRVVRRTRIIAAQIQVVERVVTPSR